MAADDLGDSVKLQEIIDRLAALEEKMDAQTGHMEAIQSSVDLLASDFHK